MSLPLAISAWCHVNSFVIFALLLSKKCNLNIMSTSDVWRITLNCIFRCTKICNLIYIFSGHSWIGCAVYFICKLLKTLLLCKAIQISFKIKVCRVVPLHASLEILSGSTNLFFYLYVINRIQLFHDFAFYQVCQTFWTFIFFCWYLNITLKCWCSCCK